jgi:DNA-binding response OmpR family regulator
MTEEKKPLGRILLKRKLISQDELDSQLAKQKSAHDGVPLASRIAQSGAVPETDVLRALSEQLGVPGIDLNQIAVSTKTLDLVPREVAMASHILPVLARDDRLFLAMANPHDKRVIDELEFVTGRRVYPYVAIATTLDRTIGEAYDARDAGADHYAGPQAPPEALARLGIERPGEDLAHPHGATSPPPAAARSVEPGTPKVVIDEQAEEAAALASISPEDLELLDEEVSKVEMLSDALRQAAGVAPRPAGGSGKTVLVVDDEEDIRKLVKRLLTEKGHQVIEADRGLLALRLVKEQSPDLILLDAMLPELHGFDIAKRIKGSDKYGAIPIVMMSAIYRGWRIAEDLKANYGIEDYIEKPFRIAEMLAKVTRLLERPAGREGAPNPEEINRTAAKCLEDGIAAYKEGAIERAIDLLRKGITVDPLAYRLRYHLALIYGKQGQIYDGIGELERAVDLNPRHFPALKNLAVLYEKAGFRHKAVEMWERCVHVAPDEETRESIRSHLSRLH